MTAEQRIKERLETDATVRAAAAGGIFSGAAGNEATDSAGYVVIVRGRLSPQPRPPVDGRESIVVSVMCVAANYSRVTELAKVVKVSLEGYSGSGIQGIFLEDHQYQPAVNDSELGELPYAVTLTFEVFTDERE